MLDFSSAKVNASNSAGTIMTMHAGIGDLEVIFPGIIGLFDSVWIRQRKRFFSCACTLGLTFQWTTLSIRQKHLCEVFFNDSRLGLVLLDIGFACLHICLLT